MRRQVQSWLDAHPKYTPKGWESRNIPPAPPKGKRYVDLSDAGKMTFDTAVEGRSVVEEMDAKKPGVDGDKKKDALLRKDESFAAGAHDLAEAAAAGGHKLRPDHLKKHSVSDGGAAPKDLGAPRLPHSWGGRRVAGLCVGVDEYKHMGLLSNAVRDAKEINKKLRESRGCFSTVICDPKTSGELLRSVRKQLQEKELLDNPPKIFWFMYAGHRIEHDKTKTVYLVPGDANPEHEDDLEQECLSLDKLLKTFRDHLDTPVRKKHGEEHAIVFVVVLDSWSPFRPRGTRGTSLYEPDPESAPGKYIVYFSCSRSTKADDGDAGDHSPFAKALLHAQRGMFAEGVPLHEAFANAAKDLKGQTPIITGQPDAIPVDFSICPEPKKSQHVGAGGVGWRQAKARSQW